jgi:hypothetical protein
MRLRQVLAARHGEYSWLCRGVIDEVPLPFLRLQFVEKVRRCDQESI